MKEAYCTFEIAELLKKKGFDTFLPFGFSSISPTKEPRKFIEDDGRGGFYDDKENWISCPTHQMAMKWLREEKYVIIFILPTKDEDGNFAYYYDIAEWNEEEGIYEMNHASNHFYCYEEATETALKYSLENLI